MGTYILVIRISALNTEPFGWNTSCDMMLLYSFLLILFSNEVAQIGCLKFTRTCPECKLIKYFEDLKLDKPNSCTCVYYNTLAKSCGKLIDLSFGKSVAPLKLISNKLNSQEEANLPTTECIFVFIDTYHEIIQTLNQTTKDTFWNSRANIHIIICSTVEDKKWINSTMKQVWQRGVFNFVLVFVSDQVEVVSYNGFLGSSANLTRKKKTSNVLFPNKLLDVGGYKFRVGMLPVKRLNKKIGGQWSGEHVRRLKLLMEMMNAQLEIIEMPIPKNDEEYLEILKNKSLDFAMVFIFFSSNSSKQFEYVHIPDRDNLIGVTPKNQYTDEESNIFDLYEVQTIIILVALNSTVAVIAALQEKFSIIESFLSGIICMNGGVFHLRYESTSTKIVFTFLSIFGLLLSVIFQCNFMSVLLAHKNNNIDTIEDLYDSNLPIYVHRLNMGYIPEILHPHCTFTDMPQLFDLLMNESNVAIILSESSLAAFMTEWGANKTNFHIMKRAIVPGLLAYQFRKNSPYIDIFSASMDSIIFLRGLDTSDTTIRYKKMMEYNERKKHLTFNSLKGLFALLTYLLFFAGIVLLCEIAWFEFNNR